MTDKKIAEASGIPVYCSHDQIKRTIEVTPNPRNPNKHPEEQIALLARIIKAQGWRAPITVSTLSHMIVRGHGRLAAAKRLGAKEVPVDFQDYKNEQEEWADLIADNRLAELANMDNQMLMDIIQEIDTGEIEISLTGYTEEDLARMISTMDGADDFVTAGEDTIPEEVETITEPGDLWILGNHRVLCGDATDPDQIGKLMGGRRAALVFTDPPYGVDYNPTYRPHKEYEKIAGDADTGDELTGNLLIPAFKLAAEHSTPEAPFYIWHASKTRKDFEHAMDAAGLVEIQYLIWSKNNFAIGWANYHQGHEPCFYAGKQGEKVNFYGGRDQNTVWSATAGLQDEIGINLGSGLVIMDGKGGKIFIAPKPPKGKKWRHIRVKKGQSVKLQGAVETSDLWEVTKDHNAEHPTQKPVELARRAIEHSTKKGEITLDPFLGSGSTLIAAEATGRSCYGTELDPHYCDVIKARWERFTGRTAERETPKLNQGADTGGEQTTKAPPKEKVGKTKKTTKGNEPPF